MKLPLRRLTAVTPLALTAILVGCGAPADSAAPEPTASPDRPSPTVAGSPSLAPRPSSVEPAPSTAPSPRPIADEPGPLELETIADGLRSPIGFATAPDGWLLVHERGGRAVAIDPSGGPLREVLDITDRVMAGGEQGLLGLVLHPGWPETARGFVHYTGSDGDTVIAELAGRVENGAPFLDARTESVLLRVEQPFANHNGGQLAFGPDGYLYLGLGDGGSGGDPLGNGQNPETLLGSILRIDVDAPADGPYAIPADNPFSGGGGAPEVYLYGLRNPWRFSFDPSTDLLWIADVGQNAWEEVHRVDPVADAGANLGWNVMEGAHCFADASCSTDGLQLPLAEYGHDAGCSITGGEVYRGSAVESLWGWYVFSDFCSGLLFGIPSDAEAPADGTALAPRVLLETGASVSAFGVDSAGELYLADIGAGVVYRIVGG